jgi:hypothetical protein
MRTIAWDAPPVNSVSFTRSSETHRNNDAPHLGLPKWPDPILRTLGKERFARVLIRENPDLLNKLRSPLNNREPLRVGA